METRTAFQVACEKISDVLIFDRSWVHRVVQTIEYEAYS